MRALQTVAAAFCGNPQARRIGHADAMLGIAWCCPQGLDVLSYSLGYHEGEEERACCSGERAEPERPQ